MNNKQMKLESPVRIQELNPIETLKKIGLQEDHTLCDIGAGSGLFTIPAAKLTTQKVYALEINDEMLSIIREKAKTQGLTNIETIKVTGDHLDIVDNSIDIALLVTVLHEIQNKTILIEEIKRLLKDNGKIAVLEFHKRETPMGPPVNHRLGKDETTALLTKAGFVFDLDFDLGDNYYCLVFQG